MSTAADLAKDHDEADETGPFTFSALSPRAQKHALDKHRDINVEYDWWDFVYRDAARMAALLGINIDTWPPKSGHAGPKIYFSGFWSQGDGASFVGWYNPKPDALKLIKAECNDETLITLAERLTILNVELALDGVERMHAKITTSGHYSHSSAMQVEPETEPSGMCTSDQEKELTVCMREFADWIYAQLEAEHEYRTSDERVGEYLAELGAVFDEDGDMI